MGFNLSGVIGPNIQQDGVNLNSVARFGRDGGLAVQETHGKWTEQLTRGNMYKATTLTAGIALIVAATTGNHPTLWNPNTGVYVAEFAKLFIARLAGTDAPGSLMWASTIPAGAAIATGGPIATFTNVAPLNALVGGNPASDTIMKWAPAVNTYTAAPVFYASLGINLFTVVVTAVIAPTGFQIDYDGSMGVAPNAAISLCCQATTTTSTWSCDLTYCVTKF